MIFSGKTSSVDNSVLFEGDYGREGYINRYVSKLKETFELSPSYFKIYKMSEDCSFTDNYNDAWIIDNKTAYDDKLQSKKISMKPDQNIDIGEVIKIEGWERNIWIVIAKEPSPLYYDEGEIIRCNLNLEYINDVGKQMSIPCVYESKNPYSSGVSEKTHMILGDNQRVITIQNNDETSKFKRDTEFTIDNITYRVTSIDRKTEANICFMVLAEYQRANQEDYTYSLDIQESNLSLSTNQIKQLNIKIKKDNDIITKPVAYESSDINIATVNSEGLITGINDGNCVITAKLRDNEDIFDTVNVEISSVPNENIEYRFDENSSNEIAVYESSDYSFYKYNNDIADSTPFIFEIDYNGNPVEIANISNVTSNICRVNANSDLIYGTIYLVAKENGIEQGRIQIKISSLWG